LRGDQVISAGGAASGASIEQDSTQVILSGGTASDTLVGDPSIEVVSAGATVVSTTVVDGGEQDVYGVASATTVSSGGSETEHPEAGGQIDGSEH
jgi:autotransporter passenger strand-loop-strand repeat protein